MKRTILIAALAVTPFLNGQESASQADTSYLRITPEVRQAFLRDSLASNPFRAPARRPVSIPVVRNVDSLRDQVEQLFSNASIGGVVAGEGVGEPLLVHGGRVYGLDDVIEIQIPRNASSGDLAGLILYLRDISPQHIVVEVREMNDLMNTDGAPEVRRITVQLDEYFFPPGSTP